MICGFLPAWDFARRRVDAAPVVAWALRVLDDELSVRPPSLERLHEHTDIAGARAAAQALNRRARRPDARALMRALVRQALPDVPQAHTAVQAVGHVRVLAPGDAITPSVLHTDAAIGHDDSERTQWFALTAARGTAALQRASL
jgi:hypothetical protein